MTVWLSVDTDDCCHLPKQRGHPLRSSGPEMGWRTTGYAASTELLQATDRFIEWVRDGPPVTVFLIAEQLDCFVFTQRMEVLRGLDNITFGCHGWGHRCWSAWQPDVEDFTEMLSAAKQRIETFAGTSFRPWFRAPGGYIAPWMAAPLAAGGFRLDSSINPTWLLRSKAGGGRDWAAVHDAMRRAGIVEREWRTLRPLISPALPATGPALSLPILGPLARKAWRRSTKANRVASTEQVEDGEVTMSTLYWHLLDHGRDDGRWSPPLHPTLESAAGASGGNRSSGSLPVTVSMKQEPI